MHVQRAVLVHVQHAARSACARPTRSNTCVVFTRERACTMADTCNSEMQGAPLDMRQSTAVAVDRARVDAADSSGNVLLDVGLVALSEQQERQRQGAAGLDVDGQGQTAAQQLFTDAGQIVNDEALSLLAKVADTRTPLATATAAESTSSTMAVSSTSATSGMATYKRTASLRSLTTPDDYRGLNSQLVRELLRDHQRVNSSCTELLKAIRALTKLTPRTTTLGECTIATEQVLSYSCHAALARRALEQSRTLLARAEQTAERLLRLQSLYLLRRQQWRECAPKRKKVSIGTQCEW